MKKKFLSILLCMSMVWGLSPTVAFADEGGTHSSHCICGANHKPIGDHKTADTKSDWTSLTTLLQENNNVITLNAGNYYLDSDTNNLSAGKRLEITANQTVTICLNGNKLSFTNFSGTDAAIKVNSGANLILTDCKGTGSITTDSQKVVEISETACFNMYGGKITTEDPHPSSDLGAVLTLGTFNMYGGKICNSTTKGVCNKGTFKMYDGTINGNQGSGVLNYTDSTFEMRGGTISGNTAYSGAGVNNSGGIFKMYDGTISDNTADGGTGGGVFNNGTFEMHGGTISDNAAVGGNLGGGVYNYYVADRNNSKNNKSSFCLYGGKVTNNQIKADKDSDGIPNNVYLRTNSSGDGKYQITISGDLDEDTSIGISLPNDYGTQSPQDITSFIINPNNKSCSKSNFFSDDPSLYIIPNGKGGFELSDTDVEEEEENAHSSSSKPKYKIILTDGENGFAESSRTKAKEDRTITLTLTPDEGYEVSSVLVATLAGREIETTPKGENTFTFTMPATNVWVTPFFEKLSTGSEISPSDVQNDTLTSVLDDLDPDSYYFEAIMWALQNHIASETGTLTFSPEKDCPRVEFVTFLWKAAGSPEPVTYADFSDVAADAYYAKAVAWAVEQGIVSGLGNGRFAPDALCTRADIMCFLYRMAGSPAVMGDAPFVDVPTDAYYAKAVAWAEKNGIASGVANGYFAPNKTCTRADAITFLYRSK